MGRPGWEIQRTDAENVNNRSILGKLTWKSSLTLLAGADVQRSGHGAVLGDLHVPAEAMVVRIHRGGGQRGRLQGVAVHLDAFQVHGLLIGC